MNPPVRRNDPRIGYQTNPATSLGHYQPDCPTCGWTGHRWPSWDQAATELHTHLDTHDPGPGNGPP